MKTVNLFMITGFILSLQFWGCKDVKNEIDKVGEDVVIRTEDRANLLKLHTDMQTIQRSIEVFHASEGRYPESLEELARKGIIARIPREPFGGEWNYDPATGTISSSSHPEFKDPESWTGGL